MPIIPDPSYPETATSAMLEVLGQPCFVFIDLARCYRDAGVDIPHKAEAEQAFFLHKMLRLALLHGDDWRVAFGEELKPVIAKAEFNIASRGS